MIAESLGIFTGIAFSTSHALARTGLKGSNPYVGAAVATAVNVVALWPLAFLLVPWERIFVVGMWPFVLDGLMVPAISRWFLYTGISIIGVYRSSSLSGAGPFFSAILALLFLGEHLTVEIGLGTGAIVAGIVMLAHRREGGTFRLSGVTFALLSALLFGIVPPIRKWGFNLGAEPLPALALSTSVNMALFLALAPVMHRDRSQYTPRRSYKYFILAGIANLLALIAYYYALRMREVVIVAPLANSYPLFNIVIAQVFFKETEQLSLVSVAGGILVVMGVAAIILK